MKLADFGAFVLAHLSPKHTNELGEKSSGGSGASAAYLVNQLVAAFPSFDDHNEFHGEKVYFLKRAQLAVACIYRRFKVKTADTESCLVSCDFRLLIAICNL